MKKITNSIIKKNLRYERRKHKINFKIKFFSNLPRLIVKKSNKSNYITVVDNIWNTIISKSDQKITTWTKSERWKQLWIEIWKVLIDKWINKICFDRNWYKYIWRVKNIADWLKEWWITI